MNKWWTWFFSVADDSRPDAARAFRLDAAAVHICALALVLAQVALRAWMLLGSWFYTDDYRLLAQARGQRLDLNYLTTPFDSQFMPVGRLVAWTVSNSGAVPTGWGTAVAFTLLFSTLAAGACWWMLVTVFGPRAGTLPLLAVYLFSAISAPAVMWWAAGLNQLPLQAVWFATVAAFVRYLRGRSRAWLAATLVILVVGLLCYVKTLLIFPVLAILAVGYFTSGDWRARLRHVGTEWWPAVVGGATVVGAYIYYYVTAVPQPFVEENHPTGLAGDLVGTMVGTSFGSAAVGGPWRWDTRNPPTGYADPALWAAQLSWVVIAAVIVMAALRRQRTGRAWLLLVASLVGAYLLLLTTRAPIAGASIGLEMRYLTETVCALVLSLGLAWLPLRGAVESSEPRERPLVAVAPTRVLTASLTAACVLGACVSTVGYARIWHSDNPGAIYLQRVAAAAEQAGSLDLSGGPVPPDVMPGYSFPYNTLERLTPLYGAEVKFPSVSQTLHSVANDGTVAPTLIDAAVTSEEGPAEGCGWRVGSRGRAIPLRGATINIDWWMRIGFLASDRTTVTVTAGDVTRDAVVNPGLGSLYVQATGTFDRVRIDGLSEDVTFCVDVIEVGAPVAGVF